MPCDDTCVDGQCLGEADSPLEVCDGACVDTQTNPIHCGGCGSDCAADQVCFAGDCWDYEPAVGCDACGACDACPGGEQCCDLSGYGTSCVDSPRPCPA